MAIKPITNTNVTNESTINRAEQTSIRSDKGNAKVVIKKSGGRCKNLTKNKSGKCYAHQ